MTTNVNPGGSGGASPLAGVRILDFSVYAALPWAASLLGDMGADVIKVEPPKWDPMRHVDNGIAPGHSAYYFGMQRSKRGLVIDLTKPASRPLLDKLISSADVVLVGMRRGVPSKLGLDYDQVAAVNDRIVYGSLTGYGESGPRADEPGVDLLVQALSGIMRITGERGGDPVRTGPSIGDFLGSLYMVQGILAALRVRDRDGRGQKVSVNLLDCCFGVMPNFVTPHLKAGVPIEAWGSAHPQTVPYQAFRAADKYFVLACPPGRKFWPIVCKATGCDDWLDDDRLATTDGRAKHREEVVSRLSAIFRTRPAAYWIQALVESGVLAAPVNSFAEALEDPQTVHNETITVLTHPEFGPYPVVQNPVRLSETPIAARGYACEPGEHTAEVLLDLGFGDDAIKDLRTQGVVA